MIRDGLSIWTGKRQFRIQLQEDLNREDGLRHPPAVFSIGADRGFLIYAGQPLNCRKCGGKGHDVEHCNQVRCRSCNGMGHSTRDCTEPKRCHLCGSEEHMARDCTKPRPYVAVVKGFLGQEKDSRNEAARAPVADLESLTGEENKTDETEEEVEKRTKGPLLEAERRHVDGGKGKSEDMESAEQPWEVVKRTGRKTAKRRRRWDPTTTPEGGDGKEVGAEPSTSETEGHAPKGTQTECMHTPLNATMSENEMEDGSETEGVLDNFII